METTVVIGTYHQPEETIQRCPSYYAADWERVALVPGDYPLRLSFTTGYTIPMPQWVLANIEGERVDGCLYSGFGGVNFASRELPREAVTYTLQAYPFQLAAMIEAGRLTLDPAFEWLLVDHTSGPRTWDEVRALV